jgi:aquaporin Z
MGKPSLVSRALVEALGTFGFFFLGFMGVAVATDITGSISSGGIAAGFGLGLGLMIFTFGHVSGGHFNPAVSTAVFVRGRMTSTEYGAYMVTQVIAAVAAGLTVRAVGGEETAAPVATSGKMLIAEFVFTFALGWVVLNVATARGTLGNSFYGLAIGFTVVAGAFAVGGISGGAFNPAVAVGAMVTGLFDWSNIWIYLLAEFAGGAAAAYAFVYVLPAEKAAGDVEAASTE